MGILDLIAAAKSEATAKVETMQKRIEEVAERLSIVTPPVPKKKQKAGVQKNKRKTTANRSKQSTQSIRDQIIKQRDNIKKNGYKHYEFIANKNCCDVCAKLNGKHFNISKLEIGVNAPPMHDGCKCSISAWENNKEYEAWLDSLDK